MRSNLIFNRRIAIVFTSLFLNLCFLNQPYAQQPKSLRGTVVKRPKNLSEELKDVSKTPEGMPKGGNTNPVQTQTPPSNDPRRDVYKDPGPRYQSLQNDQLNVRIYTLNNGLTVYLSRNTSEPRIQTYIATRAGSKNDPSDATGLAHYLEHMLFKGTDKYGSADYTKEKAELDKIEALYEKYRQTKDESARKSIYHEIDSISGVAAKYAIANEYDKMLSSIGAKGTNAFTSFEQTVYVNDIPSNQLEKWLQIETERFRNPVMRLFHTELEAVYEEKNRSLDNDGRKTFEMLFSNLFPNNNYGLQTTIGTIDHLKNPSIKKIREYYNSYYVPNNMAICLSGDLDYDKTIRMIESLFGKWESKPVSIYKPGIEPEMTKPLVKDVFGPDAENVLIGFRTGGVGTIDEDMVTLISKILFNNTAGLIDMNLNQQQKLIDGIADNYILNDYGMLMLMGKAKEGQKLEDVSSLLLNEVERLKKGEFEDWLLTAIINELKMEEIKASEDNSARAMKMVDAFISKTNWDRQVNRITRLSRITKQEIINWAQNNLKNNYVIVNKRRGEDLTVQKVIKPTITPVEVNRNMQSPFTKTIIEAPVADIEPVFLNFEKDVNLVKTNSGNEILYNQNTDNKLFELYYIYNFGTNHDKRVGLMVDYLDLLGTNKMTREQIKQEFYKIGCSLEFRNSDEELTIFLTGVEDNFDKGIKLMEELILDCKSDDEALKNLISDLKKKRADAKLNKRAILNQGLVSYAKYGPKSPFTNVLSDNELNSITGKELTDLIHQIGTFKRQILYYGPAPLEKITEKINSLPSQKSPAMAEPKAMVFDELTNSKPEVLFADYDMKQAEIMFISADGKYNNTLQPSIRLFNEYFGGGMSGIVFQTMRESKALAYSVYSVYRSAGKIDKNNYITSYIGTQADKMPEAVTGLMELLNEVPKSDNMYGTAQKAIDQVLRTERILKSDKLFAYRDATKKGINYDLRKDYFEKIKVMSWEDLMKFHKEHYGNRKYTMLVLGNKKLIDWKTLEKYGTIKELGLQEIFGY